MRLRLHGDIVRIEVDADKFEKAIAERETICRTLKEMGFLYITLIWKVSGREVWI